ncbi:transport permease protein [Actinoallomurus iriomotensis]|uniref:Transport permease protein n=1 Tax=Actinoallomurus iriomotensis TaxID=478107 RepID=A0A9W6RSD5_9ACTN|nr:transport permease protein [Actinoallomurus iriomotensis]
MWAMVTKEFRQLRRDRRTLAMMIVLPVLLLVVFGYAASFNVHEIPTVVVGPGASRAAASLRPPFDVTRVDAGADESAARSDIAHGRAVVALVTRPGTGMSVLLDGTQLFSAQAAQSALARTGALGASAHVTILYNPRLKTSWIMVPGLAGLILAFVGTVITSLGVVRERQAGTLEQLAVMPLRPWDVIIGKIIPYFLVAAADLTAIVVIGRLLFGVPFAGNVGVFALGAMLFLLVTLGMGVLISTVSQNQGQAIQLALMTLLPQILLSGLIFPLSSMAAGVRWISYVLPLTYFVRLSRAVMLKGTSITGLWQPLVLLALLGVAVLGLAVLRFRRDLAPGGGDGDEEPAVRESVTA